MVEREDFKESRPTETSCGEESTKPVSPSLPVAIVNALVVRINGRRGYSHCWEQVNTEMKCEQQLGLTTAGVVTNQSDYMCNSNRRAQVSGLQNT